MTAAEEDRCGNCGVVPERWIDVTSPGLDEERLLCSNCFAACGAPKLCSHRGITRICRRNRVLTPHTDHAEKLRG
jgi:hypothetical protein